MGRKSLASGTVSIFGGQKRRRQVQNTRDRLEIRATLSRQPVN
jgi:hypothetical protein